MSTKKRSLEFRTKKTILLNRLGAYFSNKPIIGNTHFIEKACGTYEIVTGALYRDKCPLERFIPIYLIVSGAVGIVYNVFGILRKLAKSRNGEGEEEEDRPGVFTSICNCLFGCFLFAWFIAGKKKNLTSGTPSLWLFHPVSPDDKEGQL